MSRLYRSVIGTFLGGMSCVAYFLLASATALGSDAALAHALEGRLKQISETKVVNLAHRSDANPFSFRNSQGQPDRYNVDLCKSVVRFLEVQLCNWAQNHAQTEMVMR